MWLILRVEFVADSRHDVVDNLLMSPVSFRACNDLLEGSKFEFRDKFGVAEASEVAAIVEDGRRVGHELSPLLVGDACCKGALFLLLDSLTEDQLEKDEKSGALVAALEPADLGALPGSSCHVVGVAGLARA